MTKQAYFFGRTREEIVKRWGMATATHSITEIQRRAYEYQYVRILDFFPKMDEDTRARAVKTMEAIKVEIDTKFADKVDYLLEGQYPPRKGA